MQPRERAISTARNNNALPTSALRASAITTMPLKHCDRHAGCSRYIHDVDHADNSGRFRIAQSHYHRFVRDQNFTGDRFAEQRPETA
jgi:hypothetical protein